MCGVELGGWGWIALDAAPHQHPEILNPKPQPPAAAREGRGRSALNAQLDVKLPFHLPKPAFALARGVAVPGIGVPHKRGRRGARRRRSL